LTSNSTPHAVIPMKPLERCKLRLARVLDKTQRESLVLWMLDRTAIALAGALNPSQVFILGGDDRIRELAKRRQVRWAPDTTSDLNEALNSFIESGWKEGWKTALFVSGDLPQLQPSDVQGMLDAGDGADAVIAAGSRGGTNALLIQRDSRFRFDLGGRSYARHRDQFGALGLRWQERTTSALRRDVDTPGDLAQLLRAQPDLWGRISAESEVGTGEGS
jgi:2-phospho-L-lactate guanylyltransferase